jgi:biotin carboxyl carrier protein
MSTATSENSLKNWSLLVILTLIWGTSFILIKRGLEVFSPGEVGAYRMVAAASLLLPLSLPRIKYLNKTQVKNLLLAGMLGSFIPAFLFPLAQTQLSSSLTGVLNNPLAATVGDESAKGSYVGVSFMFDQPTQIVAPRKGIVAELKMDAKVEGESLSFVREENYIEIYHEDGTFTKLTVLKAGSEKVKVGQQVFPGDVLAESGGENYSQGPHVRMINIRTVRDNDRLTYQPFPVLVVSDKGNLEIRQYITFSTVHPEEIITMEMSKKELKTYQEGKV